MSATNSAPQHEMYTSGALDPVWIHTDPYSNRPKFPQLKENIDTDVCVIGSGIAGVSVAYELVTRGVDVVMVEARNVVSGETGRTSGHLSNDLDDGYTEIASKFGDKGAKLGAESHTWAIQRVGEISEQLGIECEYRRLPAYDLSQYPKGDPKHEEEVKEIQENIEKMRSYGMKATFLRDFTIKGWNGSIDQRDAGIIEDQGTFHPTKYVVGVLNWLKQQPNFKCYTFTRVTGIDEKGSTMLGLGKKHVILTTEGGNKINCNKCVEATVVPLQKLSIIAEMEYNRTYCIAIRVPKGSIEDCLIYDNAEKYKYVRFTACDEKDDYLVIGGCDHKVGQEEPDGRFEELEGWVRERFPQATSVDYKWSGQIYDPMDYMAFIGEDPGRKSIYIVTGDSGNGLTHGVLAGKLLADEILGVDNPWADVYNPKRTSSLAKTAVKTLQHDVQINAQYKRALKTDITDIEDLIPGTGGVMHASTGKPIAVYKAPDGTVTKMSALCPHLHGVVCWNKAEESWDCPVHGSRFTKDGICVIGPSKGNMHTEDSIVKEAQQSAVGA